MRSLRGVCPAGKPVATEAMGMCEAPVKEGRKRREKKNQHVLSE